MFIKTKKIKTQYTKVSKLKNAHSYSRTKTVAVLQCDSCQSLFDRDWGSMDYRRINDHSYHVCANCNPKQFAQRKGAERRQLWKLPVDSDIDITKI